jgi:hypothetical protein
MFQTMILVFWFAILCVSQGFHFNNGKLNKLIFMGCDFYICKNIHVCYTDQTYSVIQLNKERGYFHYPCLLDEDEDEYVQFYEESIRQQLKPATNPILLYKNNSFRQERFDSKYRKMVEKKLEHDKKNWEQVSKIVKLEERYTQE